MRYVLVLLPMLIASFFVKGVEPVQNIHKDSIEVKLDRLWQELGSNKEVTEELMPQFLAALEYFPELKHLKIKVVRRDIKTTMQCRPRWDFFLHQRDQRTYLIVVDKEKEGFDGVLFEELPLNAQVGVFGHELAHVLDYSGRNTLEVIALGVRYLNKNQRRLIENRVDLLAINKGLGFQINDFSKYVFEDADVSHNYLNFKKRFYFQPGQIMQFIIKSPLYVDLD
ncbi:hypothetical protein [Roseimarinus sediminis]|uniref:hypothetical protein n=1 Tax=Roseimarinus sediminis TaxID=1610899 RepID=UPI003D250216